MTFPPTSLALPIPPSFSSVATRGIYWHSSPSYSGNGSSAYAGNGSSAYAGNGSPANISNSSLRTSDMSPLNQPHANITRTESPSSERNRPPPNISNLGLLAWACDQVQTNRPKMEYQSSQSSFNTSSDTSAPLGLRIKNCDEGVKMTEKTDIENVSSARSSARDRTPVATSCTPPSSWHIPSKNRPTPTAGWEDPTHVHEASDGSTLNQPHAKRPKMDCPSSQVSSFNTSSDTSYDGRKMTIQGKPNPSSHKETTKRDIGIDFPLKIRRTPEQTFNCTSVHRSDNEKDSKKLIDSLDLGRIKKFKETQFEYSDGVIAAKSLGPWIRKSKKFFKQEHEHEQKSIIVLSKGETLPDDLKELKRLVRSAETDFDVALLCGRNVTQCRHYKFIFSEGFELHVAENSKSEEFHYFGRFLSDPTVFYELNEPPLSNDIRNILTEERVWVNKRTKRKVFGKTITVMKYKGTDFSYVSSEVLSFPRLWYPKGHVILYGTVPQNLDDWDEINTFRQWIGDTNNLPTVTKENVTEEANRKLGCVHCLKYTVTRDGEWFELYAVQFGKAYTHRYLRKKDKPHVFLILNGNYSMDVENRLLSIAKNIPVSVQTGKFFLAGSPAATFVSTQRASQLGKMTEKKTRESNYQGLVLASMVSCLVFVSTYWGLGKKE